MIVVVAEHFLTKIVEEKLGTCLKFPKDFFYGFSESGLQFEMDYPGLEKTLVLFYRKYGNPLVVTENGVVNRANHLKACWRAIRYGADVKGYLHWALVEYYEQTKGYSMKFGMVNVDFETKKKRDLRLSALLYREIATRKEIPEELHYV